MHGSAVTAEIQRNGIPGQRPKLGLGWRRRIIVVIVIGGIHDQAVQKDDSIPTELFFEWPPNDSILDRLTAARCPVRKREVADVMNEVVLPAGGAGHERQTEQIGRASCRE